MGPLTCTAPQVSAAPHPASPVDVARALAALTECAARRPHCITSDGSLMRAALARLGLGPADLDLVPIVPERDRSAEDLGRHVTIGAVVVLKGADRAERRGFCWEVCVRLARARAVRHLSALPEALFESAAHEPPGRGAPSLSLVRHDSSPHRPDPERGGTHG